MPITPTFMNSKLTKMAGKDKQNQIFKKSKSCEILYFIYIYIYIYVYIYIGEDWEFIIHVFYWCIPLDHEIDTNIKKSNLIKGIFSHNLLWN